MVVTNWSQFTTSALEIGPIHFPYRTTVTLSRRRLNFKIESSQFLPQTSWKCHNNIDWSHKIQHFFVKQAFDMPCPFNHCMPVVTFLAKMFPVSYTCNRHATFCWCGFGTKLCKTQASQIYLLPSSHRNRQKYHFLC